MWVDTVSAAEREINDGSNIIGVILFLFPRCKSMQVNTVSFILCAKLLKTLRIYCIFVWHAYVKIIFLVNFPSQ